MTRLQEQNLHILHQLTDLLAQLSAEVYTQPLALLHEHTIGQHVRHIAEFYQCLLSHPAGATTPDVVNYDTRRRDLVLETDPVAASQALLDAAIALKLPHTDTQLILEDGEGQRLMTSLSRELSYLIEHTVHHMAILKIALNSAYPSIQVPDHFGVAHSTLRHREQMAVGTEQ
ncbi:MAG: hypothetical protein LH606_08155 [Cytophagaceae bacterium]|nr:hypothetical protein [Cytophagaceae bacterium]